MVKGLPHRTPRRPRGPDPDQDRSSRSAATDRMARTLLRRRKNAKCAADETVSELRVVRRNIKNAALGNSRE
ncbi:hypothetical protein ACQKIP_44990, partial [Streptomyces sp. NPDC059900]